MLSGRASKILEIGAFLALLILGTSVSALMYGQVAGATLTGTITDSTGALIPNASVSIRNTATGVVKQVPTDNAGFYSVANLVPGPYEVTVSAPGFTTIKQSNITLTVSQTQQLNLTLQVGATTQQVQVTAAPPLVH